MTTANGTSIHLAGLNEKARGSESRLLDVVIVGGSLGGLFAALSLKSLPNVTAITILERNPTPLLQNQGAGIVAGGDTLAFFKKYDRCNRPIAVSSQKRMYLNQQGDIVHQVEMVQNMTSWDLSYYLLRANFDGLQSGYCVVPKPAQDGTKGVYRYGCNVTSLKKESSRIKVNFNNKDGNSDSLFADLVIGADGPSSTIRRIVCPEVTRSLVGYCALRGTVPELSASDKARAAFCERFTFFHADGIQILAYLIPGTNGSIEPGERLINFVWYYNFPLQSKEFEELMTDKEGVRHHITMPPGKMQDGVWEKMKQVATDRMPPQFAEIIHKTKFPFVQAITDAISPANSFMDGHVLLMGDALANFRPHTVASTSQAAFDAMLLAQYVGGEMSHEEYVRRTMEFARLIQHRGMDMGNRSQFGMGVPLEEHITDRNLASTKREDEVYPEWTQVRA